MLPAFLLLAVACDKQTPPTQPSPSASIQNQQLAETVKWKTYSNNEYGFQINFPDNWQQVDPIIDIPAEFYIRMIKPHNSAESETGIQVLVLKGASDVGKKITIGSMPAYVIQGDNGSGYGKITYIVPKGNTYFMIGTDFSDNNSALIQEIISSFKLN
jgi:hypothetical protein